MQGGCCCGRTPAPRRKAAAGRCHCLPQGSALQPAARRTAAHHLPPCSLQREALRWGSVWAYTIHMTVVRAPKVLPECEALLNERERQVLCECRRLRLCQWLQRGRHA